MDSIGHLELTWAQGYNGSPARYVDKDVVCYQCGSNVKFIAEDGAETVFNFKGNGVGPFAVHPSAKCFAVAEQCLNPKICIYVYPTFRELIKLQDGTQLEYQTLSFSHSEYLATISGVPDFELILWNYTNGTKLTSTTISSEPVTSITFNPGSWRQICITTERTITLWLTEQSNNKYLLQSQKVKLPPSEANFGDEDRDQAPTRASTRMTSYTLDVPKAAIAGLIGEKAEQLEEIQDMTPRVVPICQAWSPTGDVFIGCRGGQLIKIDGEASKAHVLYYPPARAETPMSRVTSAANSRFQSQTDLINISRKHTRYADDTGKFLLEGSFNCIVLHRKGLYAGGQDGVLRLIDIKSEDCKIIEQRAVGKPISSLTFSPSYKHMVIGSIQGTLHLYEAGNTESLKMLKDLHWGTVVGIGCLPGNEYVVSIKEDGELQVWTMDKGHFVSSVSIGIQATCMACSPLTHVAAVGTVSGHLMMVDLTFVKKPRIVKSTRMYHVPVSNLTFDVDGKFLITGAEDGQVFVIDGRGTKDFSPIGFTVVEGEILTVTTFTDNNVIKVAVTSNNSGNRRNGADTLLYFELTDDILKDRKKHVQSLRCEFKDSSIKKMILKFGIPSFGGAVAEGSLLFAVSQKTKKLHQISLPDEIPKKGQSEPLLPEQEYPGHQLPGAKLLMSPHGKWLASYGIDGYVQVRATGSLDRFISIRPHDYHSGGVKIVAFSEDSHSVFTTGEDGVLCCYGWNFTSSGIGKAKSAMESARARKTKLMQGQKEEDEAVRNMPDWVPPLRTSRPTSAEVDQTDKEREALERAIATDEIYTTPTPTAALDATWQDVQRLESFKAEDSQYAEVKKDLRVQIRDMRRTVQEMLKQNETLPDIEKLGRHEFDLDIEEQNRLQSEADSEVQRVREEIEFDNLAKIYLREMIKKECWDDMKVKGRACQAFFSNLEVSNFPMKERSKGFEKLLNTVTKRRQIEVAELAARKAEIEVTNRPTTTADDDLGEGDDDDGEKPSTTGSLGAMYGGGSDLFYSQFDLHTREQKLNQIILLEDAIHRIKVAFNKDFDDIHLKKVSEISKIKEKNKRIQKILDDLELSEEIIMPNLSIYEEPEQLLTVNDDEVKVEKYLTPEQRKQKKEQDKLEEERRLREKGDNARERGLNMMMGGVLEIKKEDELKQDIPKPLFMQMKEQKDWTEDEQRLAGEYEKKVKDLQEEREKYRKQLETELRKNQSIIQDSMTGFDEMLQQVFMKKIKVMMVVYQEELKILRLRNSLLIEEELETQELELNRLLDHKKALKALTAQAYIESKKHLDAYKNDYENLQYEDKAMDKLFKREFNDVTAVQQDQLYRMFRRRPKIPRLKGFDTPAAPSTADQGLPNPFADRPSTARQHSQAKATLEAAIHDLDKDSNIPEGIDLAVWQRLCKFRRTKIENDFLIKQKALIFAEMEAFCRKRHDEDEQLKNDIEDLQMTISKLKNDQARVNLNLECQLLLKQGQVEIDATLFIPDYKDSALIHRSVVEELNTNIKKLGEDKIASMVESKDFRKGIIQLEWEHKKMLMLMEDLQNKMKDIQFMKVTREIQLFLNNEDYDGKKADEINKLEQTILTQLKHQERKVAEKKRILKELGKTIKSKDTDNNKIDTDLTELNVTVNERKLIDEVNADRRSDAGKEKRYMEIVQRRKLVDLAKAQAQEVAVLRAEVERLRMRTFPALVQVEH